MTNVQISLPEDLAREAAAAGLLAPQAMQSLIRSGLKAQASKTLDTLWSRLDDAELTPALEAEIVEQVRKVRARRKAA